MPQIVSKWFPNGQASIGFVAPRRNGQKPSEQEYDRARGKQCQLQEDLRRIKQEADRYKISRQQASLARQELRTRHDQEQLERALKAPEKRKRKGLNGITGYGAKMVKNGCYLLQQWFGKERLGFLTLTLPNEDRYLWACVLQWSEIIRKFNQEFKRLLERRGAFTEFCYVTEIQEKRSRNTGMLVPHLHLVFNGWDGKSYLPGRKIQWYVSWQEIQQLWKRILENELRRLEIYEEGTPLGNPRVSVERVKKSAEGYLGKYMSKGRHCVKQLLSEGFAPSEMPAHWWGISTMLRQGILGQVKELPEEILDSVLGGVDLVARGVACYVKEVIIDWQKGTETLKRRVGYALRLVESWNEDFKNYPLDSA